MTARSKKNLIVVLMIASFIGLFPVSFRLADPLFTRPYDSRFEQCILLIWPDHVEIRWFRKLSEVSPHPKDATYTFSVSADRQKWVEEQVQKLPPPHPDSVWIMKVRQLPSGTQEIKLETMRDGILGLIYEAKPNEIIPLRTRITGPGGAFIIMGVHLCVWGGLWTLVWLVRFVARHVELAPYRIYWSADGGPYLRRAVRR